MALSTTVSRTEAEAMRVVANEMAALLAKVNALIEHNSDLSIDWAAGSTPAYIAEDVDGNIEGLNFSRQDVANVVGSFAQFRNLLQNAAVTQGDHLGNVNKLATPVPVR